MKCSKDCFNQTHHDIYVVSDIFEYVAVCVNMSLCL